MWVSASKSRKTGGAPALFDHDRLVNRTDLLDIEISVRESLAVEAHQTVENGLDDAVRDARGFRPGFAIGAALEEGKALRIEKLAFAPHQFEGPVARAAVNEAEQHKYAAERAEALIHRFRIASLILEKLRIEPAQRIMRYIELVAFGAVLRRA
jgi:hypothetical protein